MADQARAELQRVLDQGGAIAAVESGYLKQSLVQSHADRRAAIESGDVVVVGVNRFVESEPNPLLADIDAAIQAVDPAVEREAVEALAAWKASRDTAAAHGALSRLRSDAAAGVNLMAASLDCARAGVTTGEWADALREVFGEYRPPTGIAGVVPGRRAAADGEGGSARAAMAAVRADVARTAQELGRPLRFLVGKPGLDGHSNGAEQIAVRARDAGFEVVYQGIRLTPDQIVAAAVEEDVDIIGLSILSGSHRALVPAVVDGLAAHGAGDIPVVVGGIIPDADAAWLQSLGVAAVFTPKDFDATAIMARVLQVVRAATGLGPIGSAGR